MKTIKQILACDVGGTRIKLGLVRGARLLAQAEMDAEPKRGLAAALKRIAQAAGPLCSHAGIKPQSLDGFGLSFPGIIEPRTEKILSTPSGKFDDAKDLDVPRLVKKWLGVPARICNDANAALAGEWHFGAARGSRSAVMMTLGTGIGEHAGWLDLEIVNDPCGAPKLVLSGAAATFARERGITEIQISLTHTRDYAAANAIAVVVEDENSA